MTRAAIAFISGPVANLIRALRPNFLLRATSRAEKAFGPPKAPAPAINVSSGSFLAPAINWSRVSAALNEEASSSRSSKRRQAFMDVSSGILGVVELWSDGFDIPVLQHSSTPLPRIYYFSIQHFFTRNEPNDLILRGVSNDAQGIETFLHRFDGLFIQAAQENDAPVGVAQVFAGAVVDRALAFLRDAILIAAREPVNRLIPFVDAKLRLYQPLLGFIFHDFRDRF